jgi:hypothetical protein
LDSVANIGASVWSGGDRQAKSKNDFSAAWAEVSSGIGAGGSATAGVDSPDQPPVRTSLLLALQDVRLNKPATDGSEQEATEDEAETAGIFAKADEEESQKTVIDEIKEKGLAEWAHEQWLERIREKARQTALADLGLTEDDVAAMAPDMQARIEQMIKEVVEEAVRQAVEKAAGENGEKRSNQAMVVSPIITGG